MRQARPIADRFWEKVDKCGPIPANRTDLGPCWLWLRYRMKNGYGLFRKTTQATDSQFLSHRVAYELSVGPIPDGLIIDHLCRNRACVNPSHLEPVTHRVNNLRGETIAAKFAGTTHCPAGHPYDEANTYRDGRGRRCRECHRVVEANRRRKQGAGPPRCRRITWKGQTKTITEWSRHLDIDLGTLSKRLNSGWSVDDAFSIPTMVRFRNRKAYS